MLYFKTLWFYAITIEIPPKELPVSKLQIIKWCLVGWDRLRSLTCGEPLMLLWKLEWFGWLPFCSNPRSNGIIPFAGVGVTVHSRTFLIHRWTPDSRWLKTALTTTATPLPKNFSFLSYLHNVTFWNITQSIWSSQANRSSATAVSDAGWLNSWLKLIIKFYFSDNVKTCNVHEHDVRRKQDNEGEICWCAIGGWPIK